MVPQPEQWKPAGPSVWHRFRTAKDLLSPSLPSSIVGTPALSGRKGVTVGPVVVAASDQSHAHPVALQVQAVAVVFHFMDPVRTAGHGFADFWTISKFRQAPL
jgi:hypothetical protein